MSSNICKGCNSEIRRTYSVASCGEDDYLATCNCPTDWPVVFLQLGIIGTLVGLFALISWLV